MKAALSYTFDSPIKTFVKGQLLHKGADHAHPCLQLLALQVGLSCLPVLFIVRLLAAAETKTSLTAAHCCC